MPYHAAQVQQLNSRLESALASHERGDLEQAMAVYREILAVAPEHPPALRLLGTALLQLGAAHEAVSYLERAARRQRDDPHLLANLAQAYLALRRYGEAEKTYRNAVRLAPREVDLHTGVATALALAGKLDEAGVMLERLATRFPEAPLVWFNLGNARRDRREPGTAIEAYRRALELDPSMIEARLSIGSVFHSQQRFDEAEIQYRTCMQAAPDYADARYNLASLMMDRGRYADAERMWREMLRQAPARADVHRLLGAALGHQKRLFEALACYQRAAELAPDDTLAAQTYGGALIEAGRAGEGLRWLVRASLSDPDSASLKRVMAGALLAQGCLQDGWAYHAARAGAAELRAGCGAWNPDTTPVPRLAGARVRVVGEQGLGDELFFLRYAVQLAPAARHLTYRASPKLQSLLERAAGLEAIAIESADSQPAEVCVLAGDLPLALGTTDRSPLPTSTTRAPSGIFEPRRCISIYWPAPPPPLAIPPLNARLEEMRDRLAAAGPPPYFGVTWRGGIAPQEQRGATWVLFKAIDVHALAHALRGLNATVVSLQRAPLEGETGVLAAALGQPVHDFSAVNDDLEGMLALLALLDEYIGVSNTNMHLRAAAGRTARVLVPAPAEWRWMQAGRSSPWFAGFSIYRQSLQGDWTQALAALKSDLEANLRGDAGSNTR